MGMQGVGCGFRQCQLAHRLAHIAGDERHRGLHCGNDALGFRETLQAHLPAGRLLGHGTDGRALGLDIRSAERAVTPHTTL